MHKILLAAILFCSACSILNKPATDTPPPVAADTTAKSSDTTAIQAKYDHELQDQERFRLVVSFYSRGSGADGKAIETFHQYLAGYEGWSKKKIDYDKTPWGKEGEVDYCMKLLNLDPQAQKDFVLQVREVLLISQLVHIAENTPCMHKH